MKCHGMEEVVGSIPTRSTILSITYRGPPSQLGVIWRQMHNFLNQSKKLTWALGLSWWGDQPFSYQPEFWIELKE